MPGISPEIKRKMAAPEAEARVEAARALGRIPGPESLGYLRGMLSDGSPEVVYASVRSLAEMGGREAVEEILPLLRSEDARLRNLAVEILARIGPDAFPPVAALVSDPDRDVRKFAVDILKMMRMSEAEETLVQALYDQDDSVAAAAAEALGAQGTPRVVPHLAECLGRPPWLKYAVLKSLGEIGDRQALPALHGLLKSGDAEVKIAAADALAALRDAASVSFLMCLAADASEPVRSAAAAGLRTFDLAGRETNLRGLLQAARAGCVAFGLDAIPDALLPMFRQAVLDLCRHGDAGVRRRAVARCAAFDDDAAFEAVADALADPAPEVRLAGIRGMTTCAGRNVGRLLFNAAAEDADSWNSYEAVEAYRSAAAAR